MTKEQALNFIKLLSALESWTFATGQRLPDWLQEDLSNALDALTKEVLK